MNKFWYTMDKSGVAEILKSGPVKAALAEAAEKKTAEANRMLHSHDKKAAREYMHSPHNLTFTAVENVHTTGITTELDQKRHHTLNAINH